MIDWDRHNLCFRLASRPSGVTFLTMLVVWTDTETLHLTFAGLSKQDSHQAGCGMALESYLVAQKLSLRSQDLPGIQFIHSSGIQLSPRRDCQGALNHSLEAQMQARLNVAGRNGSNSAVLKPSQGLVCRVHLGPQM